MREELRKHLNRNRERVVSELEINVGFLSGLVSKCVIENEHKDLIQSKATQHQKADALIEILSRRQDTSYDQFCLELRKLNSDLADLLTKIDSDIVRREFSRCFVNRRADLVKRIDIEHGLLSRLLEEGVIDEEHKKDIESRKSTPEQVEALISILKRRDEECVQKFWTILHKKQPRLVERCVPADSLRIWLSETELLSESNSLSDDRVERNDHIRPRSQFDSYPRIQCCVLGGVQIICGLVAFILAACIPFDSLNHSGFGGLMVFMTGILVIASGFARKKSIIVGQTIFSGLSIVALLSQISLVSLKLYKGNYEYLQTSRTLIVCGCIGFMTTVWTISIGCHYVCCKCCCPWYSDDEENGILENRPGIVA